MKGRVSGKGKSALRFAAPPLDIADQGSHEVEEAVTLGLADNEQHLMEEIDAALARIEEGTFGICQHCGQAISKESLRALPYSRTCVLCMGELKKP
jgi:DnaK suppressor protein